MDNSLTTTPFTEIWSQASLCLFPGPVFNLAVHFRRDHQTNEPPHHREPTTRLRRLWCVHPSTKRDKRAHFIVLPGMQVQRYFNVVAVHNTVLFTPQIHQRLHCSHTRVFRLKHSRPRLWIPRAKRHLIPLLWISSSHTVCSTSG